MKETRCSPSLAPCNHKAEMLIHTKVIRSEFDNISVTKREYNMTDKQINTTPIWPSRLIFNSKLLYNKKLKDLTETELFEVRKYSLQK